MTYVLFDIGGTKTRVVVTKDLKTLGKVESFKTPTKFDEGVKKIVEAVKKLTKDKPVAIAGGIRGLLTEDKTGIQNDVMLKDWIGKSLVNALKKHFDILIYLENDTAIAGIGEAIYGAGKGLDIVAYHTISTGVGGARIVNGDIDETSIGFEPGHQILDIDRTVLGDDITPTLENLVSGTALEERFGAKPYEIPQSDIVWDELAKYLAQGLRNTTLYWSPDVIVLGGSMIVGDPCIAVDSIRKYTVQSLDGFVASPLITKAELGDLAGLYGAMAILKKCL
ncbi:MAG: putative NBD/HSP70 family sugar kinase [Candidatus Paceibacteria bacterium]|jgi:predicted NBD/HSP70 family sugar kinase